MGTRDQLSQILRVLLGSGNVYFQPPPTVKMKYPAIVYEKNTDYVRPADNGVYSRMWKYTIMIIDENPDTVLPDKMAELPYTKLNRAYTFQGLNHYVFNTYF